MRIIFILCVCVKIVVTNGCINKTKSIIYYLLCYLGSVPGGGRECLTLGSFRMRPCSLTPLRKAFTCTCNNIVTSGWYYTYSAESITSLLLNCEDWAEG